MRLNRTAVAEKKYTHGGAVAAYNVSDADQLRRSVLSCMLWEDSFYESGVSVADRISSLVPKVAPEIVSEIAIQARADMKLRHVPLLLACEMAKHKSHAPLVADTVSSIIQRADELTEILSIYSRGRTGSKKLNKLSHSLQKGIARAFQKFDEYSLAKYNQDSEIKLRDVLFLVHAKPHDKQQAKLWKRLIDGELKTPDTWEVAISQTDDKKKEWTRLLKEEKLFALALLRNLRNMRDAGVDRDLIKKHLLSSDVSRVLPFRFVAAATATPEFENELDELLISSINQAPKLKGKTILVIDVSGSMDAAGNISKHSDMTRLSAAGALAAIARERCEQVSIYATAGNDITRVHKTELVPGRHGMALVDLFKPTNYRGGFYTKLGGGGIFLTQCLEYIAGKENSKADRIIVFTDEQDCDTKLRPDQANAFGTYNYLVNISSEKNGIGYKPKWTHIDGFSEAIIEYIRQAEV